MGKLLSYFGIGILKNPETNILPSSYPFQIPFTLVYDPVLSFSRNKFPYFLISTNIFISQKFQIKIFPASDTRLRRRENQMKSKWKHDWMKMKKRKIDVIKVDIAPHFSSKIRCFVNLRAHTRLDSQNGFD